MSCQNSPVKHPAVAAGLGDNQAEEKKEEPINKSFPKEFLALKEYTDQQEESDRKCQVVTWFAGDKPAPGGLRPKALRPEIRKQPLTIRDREQYKQQKRKGIRNCVPCPVAGVDRRKVRVCQLCQAPDSQNNGGKDEMTTRVAPPSAIKQLEREKQQEEYSNTHGLQKH